jgi:hypothetical protein
MNKIAGLEKNGLGDTRDFADPTVQPNAISHDE